MTDFYDETNHDSLSRKNDNFRIDDFNFNSSNTNSNGQGVTWPGGGGSYGSMTAAQPPASQDIYGNSMPKMQDGTDPKKQKWSWSSKVDEMLKPRPGEHAHNAALKGLYTIGQMDDYPEPDWKNFSMRPSLRTVPEKVDTDEQRLKDIRNLPNFYEDSSRRAREHEAKATGVSAYQDRQQTAALGMKQSDYITNAKNWNEHPVGKVTNQLGLNGLSGILESTSAKTIDLPLQGANAVSQDAGGKKPFQTLSSMGKGVENNANKMINNDRFFTHPDGRRTPAGEIMEWGNAVAKNAVEATVMVMASKVWGAATVLAKAIPLNVAHAYLKDFNDTMARLNEMNTHMLWRNPEVMAYIRLNRHLGKNEWEAMHEAKKAVAKKEASLSAGGRLAREIISYKVSEAVPEDSASFIRDVTKDLSFNVMTDKLGQWMQRAMENGHIVHEGDTAR